MVTNSIDFGTLLEKTSAKFVDRIKRTVDHISTWKESEIQFHIEEDQYTLTVLMCYFGSVTKCEYRFTTEEIREDQIYWTDISNFFDIKYEMKKLENNK